MGRKDKSVLLFIYFLRLSLYSRWNECTRTKICCWDSNLEENIFCANFSLRKEFRTRNFVFPAHFQKRKIKNFVPVLLITPKNSLHLGNAFLRRKPWRCIFLIQVVIVIINWGGDSAFEYLRKVKALFLFSSKL